jgi:hypothetical protein
VRELNFVFNLGDRNHNSDIIIVASGHGNSVLVRKGEKGSVREFRNYLLIGVTHKRVGSFNCGLRN